MRMRVVQPHPVVRAAAAGDRVLVELPQSGHRLSRVEDPGSGAGNGVDIRAGERGDATHAPEDVERRALAGKHGACRARNARELQRRVDGCAVGD